MKAKPLPPIEYLNECFELSEDSPSGLIWKVRPRKHFRTSRGCNIFNGCCSGKRVGGIYKNPKRKDIDGTYWQTNFDGKRYLVHRIYYSVLHQIDLPDGVEIDHIDGNGLHNTHGNVRISTHAQNNHNRPLDITNTSGVKGVFYRKDRGAWYGRVKFNGVTHGTGCSPSKEIIIEMVREMREKLHKQFTNHG